MILHIYTRKHTQTRTCVCTQAHTNTYMCVHVCMCAFLCNVYFSIFASSIRRVLRLIYTTRTISVAVVPNCTGNSQTDTKTHEHNDTRPHAFFRSLRYHRLSIYMWGGHAMRPLQKCGDIKKIKSFLIRLPGEDMKMKE